MNSSNLNFQSLSLLLITVFVLNLVSCYNPVDSVRGLVVEVVAKSPIEVETLTLVDQDNTKLKFYSNGTIFQKFTPSHLREHMLLGDPITVWFERQGGILFLKEIKD